MPLRKREEVQKVLRLHAPGELTAGRYPSASMMLTCGNTIQQDAGIRAGARYLMAGGHVPKHWAVTCQATSAAVPSTVQMRMLR